jgi:hypothetical protein
MRPSLLVLASFVALNALACGGDDSVNPTNPDASPPSAKAADAATDGARDGHAAEASGLGAADAGGGEETGQEDAEPRRSDEAGGDT